MNYIKIMFYAVMLFYSAVSFAKCSELQGVTLCDNGDSEIQLGDRTYTSQNNELSNRKAYHDDNYGYDGHGYNHNYHSRQNYRDCNYNGSTCYNPVKNTP